MSSILMPVVPGGQLVHGGQIVGYDYGQWSFRPAVLRALNLPLLGSALSTLHKQKQYDRLVVGTDHKTIWHEQFYSNYQKFVGDLYDEFIKKVVKPMFGEPIVYQRIPSFRVHLPGNVGVGEFHSDGDYNHPPGEINFMLPLTDCCETASIWIESGIGNRDYRPVNMTYGQMFMFDGRRLRHGNLLNETGFTRVSFDFRVIPERLYQASEGASYNSNLKFCVGEYYSSC